MSDRARKMLDVGGKLHDETTQCRYSGCTPADAAPSLDAAQRSHCGCLENQPHMASCPTIFGSGKSQRPSADSARIGEIRERVAGEVASLDYERWYGEDIPYLLAELERREKQWRSWGVVEVAARNQSVADYCKHWEERTEKAETELANAQREIYCCDDVRLDQGLTVAISDLQRAREVAESSLAAALQERDALRTKLLALNPAVISHELYAKHAGTIRPEPTADEGIVTALCKVEEILAAKPMPEKGEL